MQSGDIISPVDVMQEIERQDDELLAWTRERRVAFHELDAPSIAHAQAVVSRFPKFGTQSRRNNADPFVIAMARATSTKLVTYEDGGSEAKPKIPFICEQFGVPVMRFADLVRRENWVF